MAEKERRYLPQSTAGLIRYFEEESDIKIKPEHVIWVTIIFAAIVILLKFMA